MLQPLEYAGSSDSTRPRTNETKASDLLTVAKNSWYLEVKPDFPTSLATWQVDAGKRSALMHTFAAGETASAVSTASQSVASTLRKVIL